jgi:hypothetical protein
MTSYLSIHGWRPLYTRRLLGDSHLKVVMLLGSHPPWIPPTSGRVVFSIWFSDGRLVDAKMWDHFFAVSRLTMHSRLASRHGPLIIFT